MRDLPASPAAPSPFEADLPGVSLCHCHALRHAARRLTAFYDAAMAPFGLRISQWVVLNRLRLAGPTPLHALARELGLDRTTLGRNIRPLERDGLLRSEPDGADKRIRRLSLTDEGLARVLAGMPAWKEAQLAVERRFGPAESGALRGELHRLAASVDLPEATDED